MSKPFILSLLVFAIAGLTPGLNAQEFEQPEENTAAPARPSSTDKTSLRIIDLHLKARGGPDKLMALQTVQLEGEIKENIKDYKLEILLEAPARIRSKSTNTHMGDDYVTVSASDGTITWRQDILPEKKSSSRMNGLDKQLLELDAMLPFLFTHREEAGHVFAYRGKDKFAKREVYVLHGWLANGLELDILLDAQSFHVINYRQPYSIGGKIVQIDRAPAGLTRVGDTWWEKGYVYRFRGKAFREISFKSIEAAGPPPENAFTQPPQRERWLKIKR